MIKKSPILIAVLLLILIGVLLWNTIKFTVEEAGVVEKQYNVTVDKSRVSQNLAASIRFKTISYQDPKKLDGSAFTGFLQWLEDTYPGVHDNLERKFAGGLTPIYVWRGTDQSLKPVLLTGHYDVVPVLSGTEQEWQEPPFSGNISEGFIWGRGALDDKIGVIGMLDAAELLITQGFQPTRTIYFIFGHDEEVGGRNGAGRAVAALKKQGVEFFWSLDEGSMILDGLIPGIDKPIASINIAEKGYLTLDLKARSEGGHSALPPKETAVGILANAILKLQENRVAGGLTGVSADFFNEIGRNFSFVRRLLFANQWLFGPMLESELSKTATTNALLRTTTAPTMLSGSSKENILPIEAIATVNFRLHPRDTIESVIEHVKSAVDDERVEIVPRQKGSEASPVSSHDVEGFSLMSSVFQQVFGDVVVVPGLTIAATDSRHYSEISENSYRINPVVFGPEDVPRIHGTDERISVEGYAKAVEFYAALMLQIK